VTPEWYARVFAGFGIEARSHDNVIETVRAVNPRVKVLVGPVRPFNRDQTGNTPWQIDVPWLNYLHTLVTALKDTAKLKAANGIPFVLPDGYALQAPGRPDAPELKPDEAPNEPGMDVLPKAWNGAQAGFRVYKDWLAVINYFDVMRGLPVYITSTNTFTPDAKIPPAKNYPKGWLVAALNEVNTQPQIHALCWFMDGLPADEQWDLFSLTKRVGLVNDASDDFDALLQTQ
jgi:hypothetical protein